MTIDVMRTRAAIARTLLTGTLFCVPLYWSYLQVASAAVTESEAQVTDILKIEADPEFGEYLAGECLTCHTAIGSGNNIPGIHGKEARYIVAALVEYKNKTRENETMRSVAGALGNDEIAAIAAYFSVQSK